MKRALLFSGQGAQQIGMNRDLLASPTLAEIYRQADAIVGYPLSQITAEGPEEKLTSTAVCQPALYVHGYALLTATREKIPDFHFEAAAGLSLGEYTAHVAAGTFDFTTGLELVHERATLMQQACDATEGGMLTLLGADAALAVIIAQAAGLDVANYNCPGQIVLSGKKELIPPAVEIAKAHGVRKAIPLKVAGAYHSHLMKSAEVAMVAHLQTATMVAPRLPVAANFTGELTTTTESVRELLARQVSGSVRWEGCIHTLIGLGVEQFVEFGPGGVLAGLLKRIDPTKPCISIGSLAQLEEHLTALSA